MSEEDYRSVLPTSKMPTTINIRSNDGKTFPVQLEVVKMSEIIQTMLKNLSIGKDSKDEEIKDMLPLPNVDGDALEKVLEWRKEHKNDTALRDDDTITTDGKNKPTQIYELKGWDKEFINTIHWINELAQ